MLVLPSSPPSLFVVVLWLEGKTAVLSLDQTLKTRFSISQTLTHTERARLYERKQRSGLLYKRVRCRPRSVMGLWSLRGVQNRRHYSSSSNLPSGFKNIGAERMAQA